MGIIRQIYIREDKKENELKKLKDPRAKIPGEVEEMIYCLFMWRNVMFDCCLNYKKNTYFFLFFIFILYLTYLSHDLN